METVDVIRGAKDALLTHGWIKGDAGSTRKGFCLAGAIGYSGQGDTRITPKAYHLVAEAAELNSPGHIAPWNDHPMRSFEDVIGVLDKAMLLAAPPAAEPEADLTTEPVPEPVDRELALV